MILKSVKKEDACEDCGCDICRCPDDWLIQNEFDSKFSTPPVVFVLEEQIEQLKSTLDKERKKFYDYINNLDSDIEELDLLRTFIITKGLEEEFDKWVSERLENEKK